VRIEDHLPAEPVKTYPCCTGGGVPVPPEECGGPEDYLAGLDEVVPAETFEDWGQIRGYSTRSNWKDGPICSRRRKPGLNISAPSPFLDLKVA
jgi:hypothetical protein